MLLALFLEIEASKSDQNGFSISWAAFGALSFLIVTVFGALAGWVRTESKDVRMESARLSSDVGGLEIAVRGIQGEVAAMEGRIMRHVADTCVSSKELSAKHDVVIAAISGLQARVMDFCNIHNTTQNLTSQMLTKVAVLEAERGSKDSRKA